MKDLCSEFSRSKDDLIPYVLLCRGKVKVKVSLYTIWRHKKEV